MRLRRTCMANDNIGCFLKVETAAQAPAALAKRRRRQQAK